MHLLFRGERAVMGVLSAENKRWIKNRIKMILFNHAVYKKHSRFSRSEYNASKAKYDAYIKEITDAIRAYPDSHDTSLRNDAEEYIVPDETVSAIGDQMGRVFRYHGLIYRGIYADSAEDFERLWNTGILQVLAEYRLIPEVRITGYRTDEFALVLGVEQVTIQENMVWSYAMVKDACILITLLKSLLNPFGFTLIDGHLNNVTFHKGNPMFVDIGSIIPLGDNGFMTELVYAGVYRLAFGFIGNSMMYRLPTHDNANANMWVFPRQMNLLSREYLMASEVMKRYYLLRSGFFARHIVHKVFDLHDFEPQDIDLLFPITEEESGPTFPIDWNKAIAELDERRDTDQVITLFGTCGEAEAAMLDHDPYCKLTCMDFNEHRLDRCYLRLKDYRKDTAFYLYNYIYVLDEQAERVKADLAICVDPLNDSGAFWPVKDNVLAYKLSRFADKYLVLYYPVQDEKRYQEFAQAHLLSYAQLKRTGVLNNSACGYMVLNIKEPEVRLI